MARGVGAIDVRDGAIGARDGGVDGDGNVEEADALWQLDCCGDGGVGLCDAVDGGGEALQKRERLARAGVDEAVIARRGRAARGGARADSGVAGASGGSGALLG